MGISNPGRAFDSNVLWNFKAENTSILAAGLERVINGTGSAVFDFIGNSTTAGRGAGTGVNATDGARALSFVAELATLLTADEIPAFDTAMWGDAAYGASPNLYDPRVLPGVGWANSSDTIGANSQLNSTTTNPFGFAPLFPTDTLATYYQQAPGFDVFTVDVGGAPLDTIDGGAGANSFLKATVTAPLAANTWNIRRTGAGTNARICGLDAWNSTIDQIRCRNMGWGGSTIANWAVTTNPISPSSALGDLSETDCFFIDLLINDWQDGTAISSVLTSFITVLTALPTTADRILIVPIQSGPGNTPFATQNIYVQAIYYLAQLYNLPVISIYQAYPQPFGLAAGFYEDSVHYNAPGYAAVSPLVRAGIYRAAALNGIALPMAA